MRTLVACFFIFLFFFLLIGGVVMALAPIVLGIGYTDIVISYPFAVKWLFYVFGLSMMISSFGVLHILFKNLDNPRQLSDPDQPLEIHNVSKGELS